MRRIAFLTDKDLANVLQISSRTLRNVLRDGPNAQCVVDLRKAGPIYVGTGRKYATRRWSVGRVAEITGMTREDIWIALE